MKMARMIVRLLFGACWLFFGLNGLLHFWMPVPKTPPPEAATALANGFAASGYMWQFIAGTEVFAGALLLSGLFVPLALTVIAPIVLNILAFHLYANREGLEVAFVVVALELFLAIAYRKAFAGVLSPRYADGSAASAAPKAAKPG
jgi:uncharacterized membrane protein YphA (DoxX/SURF4 family)